jgi:hypothetical protein
MNFDNTAIYEFSAKMGLESKTARHLADAAEDIVSAAQAAIKDLEELIAKVSSDDGDMALGAAINYARLAGYSNTPETNVAKARQAAGRIEGIVGTI